MARWKTDAPDRLEAVSYTRDFSAQGVLDDLSAGETDGFHDDLNEVAYGNSGTWKAYKITVVIEPA